VERFAADTISGVSYAAASVAYIILGQILVRVLWSGVAVGIFSFGTVSEPAEEHLQDGNAPETVQQKEDTPTETA
jgi:hypothetical protein